MAKIEDRVEELIKEKIKTLGYLLYDVEYIKEGKDYYLRIYIDNEKGITLEDCELVSNSITEILDEKDYIKEQYFLEVSSPGIERVLKKDRHLQSNLGSKVQVKLFKPLEKQKQIIGILDSFNEQSVTIKNDSETIEILRQNIAQIKTIYNWK